jgi:hypothetical protein
MMIPGIDNRPRLSGQEIYNRLQKTCRDEWMETLNVCSNEQLYELFDEIPPSSKVWPTLAILLKHRLIRLEAQERERDREEAKRG